MSGDDYYQSYASANIYVNPISVTRLYKKNNSDLIKPPIPKDWFKPYENSTNKKPSGTVIDPISGDVYFVLNDSIYFNNPDTCSTESMVEEYAEIEIDLETIYRFFTFVKKHLRKNAKLKMSAKLSCR